MLCVVWYGLMLCGLVLCGVTHEEYAYFSIKKYTTLNLNLHLGTCQGAHSRPTYTFSINKSIFYQSKVFIGPTYLWPVAVDLLIDYFNLIR